MEAFDEGSTIYLYTLKGRERVVPVQPNIETVSRAIVRKLPKDVVERMWDFQSV